MANKKMSLEIEEIIELYLKGNSTTVIADLANVTPRYIRMILQKHNVEKRSRGSWKRKYKINEHFFSKWSPEMAYILGFFFADGYIAKNNQSVTFSQNEIQILEGIRYELDSNHPIRRDKKTGVYNLICNSKLLKNDLITHHKVTHSKSIDAVFPDVPTKYISHFVRGYFDGDGHIYKSGYLICFVGGSKDFMTSLKNILAKELFNTRLICDNEYYRVYISGIQSVSDFANWIYHDKNLYLERKFKTFKSLGYINVDIINEEYSKYKVVT